MSEFKVGTPIVYISPKKPKRIYHVLKCHASQNWIEFGNVALKQKGKQLKSMFRKAEQEEIAAGHRIDNDLGDDSHIENHISPLCKTIGERS
ncbi:hypothetical protein [Acinetobacter baumannii]|uniref:hypothetical protein n=1 Tax=Acinetobacter baumannii TaxID=470 RepID=UPI00070FA4AE|nr:hypothetical protein [Acinetobacter baumannii]EHU2507932.1 hypothetical protein [Acinetobacter baumannii]KRI30463.1 hypothetical protein APB98_11330 [Acinetobacter baumannii]HCD3129297.1 hypothetical protein [Acinetobacter baumannii]